MKPSSSIFISFDKMFKYSIWFLNIIFPLHLLVRLYSFWVLICLPCVVYFTLDFSLFMSLDKELPYAHCFSNFLNADSYKGNSWTQISLLFLSLLICLFIYLCLNTWQLHRTNVSENIHHLQSLISALTWFY